MFKRDTGFVVLDEGKPGSFDQSSVPVPLVAGRRPLHEDELNGIINTGESTLPSIMKFMQSSIYQNKESIKADVRANREKNKLVTLIKRSPVYHLTFKESTEDKKIKATMKKMVTAISRRKLVTNDSLGEIASFMNNWLKEKKNLSGDALKEMLVDLEIIDALTSGSETMVRGKELTGKIDGYIVFRK